MTEPVPGRLATHEVPHQIQGIGTPALEAHVGVRTLSAGERLRRLVLGAGAGVLVAVLALPIPLVHLVLPPIALVTGTVLGVRRCLTREIIVHARATCPRCGQEQSLGLTGARYRMPREVKCFACHQLLTLTRA